MRTTTKYLIGAVILALAYWPTAFYSRPYPAFGGESLLLVFLAGLAIANYFQGKEEKKHDK